MKNIVKNMKFDDNQIFLEILKEKDLRKESYILDEKFFKNRAVQYFLEKNLIADSFFPCYADKEKIVLIVFESLKKDILDILYIRFKLKVISLFCDKKSFLIGIEKFKNNFYDIILLDLMMPKFSGEEVCKIIRKTSNIPIIVLTAKDQTLNKVELLDMGADDYLTKPFEIEELFARIRVALRNKSNFTNTDYIYYDILKLDLKTNALYKNEKEISLTKTEYNLFHYLLLNKELVVSREKILNEVWGYDYMGEEKIVDVYINALRKKIDYDENKFIHTVRGFGYVLKKDDEKRG